MGDYEISSHIMGYNKYIQREKHNMPAKSQDQFRFMKAIESGSIKKEGLSPEKAKEFTEGVNYKKLPKKKRFKKLLE
jgi:hypothetical protein